jgi:hypothetical protein
LPLGDLPIILDPGDFGRASPDRIAGFADIYDRLTEITTGTGVEPPAAAAGAPTATVYDMPRLVRALSAFGSDRFRQTLKLEIEGLDPGELPLALGTNQGGQVDASQVTATVLAVTEGAGSIRAKVGVFFQEIVGGCSCGDEPVSENAYCEFRVLIDKGSGAAEFVALPDR